MVRKFVIGVVAHFGFLFVFLWGMIALLTGICELARSLEMNAVLATTEIIGAFSVALALVDLAIAIHKRRG